MHVKDSKALVEFCAQARAEGAFAWDTEFIQDRTYWPRLCLVQVATRETVALVDPLALPDLGPLWDLVADPAVQGVVHAGLQDFQIAFDASDRPPRNIFDTQIAAAFAGHGDSISYAGLLTRELGVRLAKKETMTDWSRRPLTDAQIEYALDDVRHLLPLRDRLSERLQQLGRLEWIAEEHQPLENADAFRRDPRRAWERLSRRRSLDRRALAVLREVAAWREETAASRDVPRNRILGDELLVEVAKRAPKTRDALSAIRSLHERLLAQYGDEIVARVARGLAVPTNERPDSPAQRSEDPARARLVDLMDLLVQVRARETGIGRNVLATRVDLENVAAIHWGESDGGPPPPVLRGWRGEIVGADLRRLLDGEILLGVDPHTHLPEVTRRAAPPAP
ncbi:MAG: ribonuclease D [bacterium]